MGERIGILCVHGMGEQKPGETARDFAATQQQALAGLGYGVEPQVLNHQPAIVRLIVTGKDLAKPVTMDVREVFWADIGYPGTFRDQISFWLWGLGIWARRFGKETAAQQLPGAQGMIGRKPPSNAAGIRVRLFLAAVAFAIMGGTVRVATHLAGAVPFVGPALRRRLENARLLNLVVAYMGDVKLYQEDDDRFSDFMGIQERPRITIRRRLIAALADMALERYDRWYVTAHSLGSVVAFDGLMEIEETLPNYLDPRRVQALRNAGLVVARKHDVPKKQRPPRPGWVKPNEVLLRPLLFERLSGFLTYGSPIDKFRTMWSWISVVNPQPATFPSRFEWHNVYENADPVAGSLDYADVVGSIRGIPPAYAPANYGLKREAWVWNAHTHYFARPTEGGSLAQATALWLIGKPFVLHADVPPSKKQPGQAWMIAQLAVLTLLVPFVIVAAITVAKAVLEQAGFAATLATVFTLEGPLGWYLAMLAAALAACLAAASCARD